jgi:heme ABC exporter ATP-binding subunit CcmA
MPAVLAAHGVSRRFGRQWVLREVELSLRSGEAIVLVGANGAGKSTLLSILATLLRPSEGHLELFGQPAFAARDAARARMGYLPHQTLLDDALSAAENLRYYAALYRLRGGGARLNALLDEVGLAARRDDLVGTFSRGMRQRLSLARALLHDPELLLLDEPFSGLDALGIRDLAARLRREREGGRAQVVVTHQLEPVLSWCDRIVALSRGRVALDEPAQSADSAGWAMRLAAIAERA